MIYPRNDVDLLDDPLAFVRAHPQMFLAQVSGEELALTLVRGVLLLTQGPVAVTHLGRWWLVAADVDWLRSAAGAAAEDVFERLVPFPEAGPNSVRPEVLLTALAATVTTWQPRRANVLKGGVSDDHDIWRVVAAHPLWKRLVAFRMDE